VTGALVEQRVHAALAAAYRLGWARHGDGVAGILAQSAQLRCPVETREGGDLTHAEQEKVRDNLLKSIGRNE